jgi:hypothetical protein
MPGRARLETIFLRRRLGFAVVGAWRRPVLGEDVCGSGVSLTVAGLARVSFAGGVPGAPFSDVDGEHRGAWALAPVLLVFLVQQPERPVCFLSVVEHARPAAEPDPP